MTPKEFKITNPEYKDLQGDALWDKMEDVLLESNNTLTADPNREIHYHDAISVPTAQLDGTVKEMSIQVEDDTKTVWLNSAGEKVKIKEIKSIGKATESYRMAIWDASKK